LVLTTCDESTIVVKIWEAKKPPKSGNRLW
jgi:hypothetical protein